MGVRLNAKVDADVRGIGYAIFDNFDKAAGTEVNPARGSLSHRLTSFMADWPAFDDGDSAVE